MFHQCYQCFINFLHVLSNSGGALTRYMSQESLSSNITTPGARRRRPSLRSVDTTVTVLVEEEEEM